MSRQLGEGLLKVVVQPVDGVLLPGGQTPQPPLTAQQLPQGLADGGVIRQKLRHDVVGPLQGVGGRLHPLLWVDEALRRLHGVGAVPPLVQQQLRQRRQPFFTGHGGTGAALLLIGAVQVLHLRQRPGAVDGRRQLRRQLPLSLDGGLYLLPPLVQIPQIGEPVLQLSQGGVVHAAVKLLPVAGDEGNGVSPIQQVDDVLHMDRGDLQLLRQNFCNGLHICSFRGRKPGRRAVPVR